MGSSKATIGSHPGEIEARRRAGVAVPDRTPSIIRTELPPIGIEFLESQSSLLLGVADRDGRPWVALLTGAPGFLSAQDGRNLSIETPDLGDHPLLVGLEPNVRVGTLVVDFQTRDRVRLNGVVDQVSGDRLVVRAEEAFSNCPKYIQTRQPTSGWLGTHQESTSAVDERFRAAFERADALFLASGNQVLGFDVSHRGGQPGFLRWADEQLVLPDYQGNRLYQTIGNLLVDPQVGILAIDFATGRLNHGTGTAVVDWSPSGDREIRIAVDEAVSWSPTHPWVAPTIEVSPHLSVLARQ